MSVRIETHAEPIPGYKLLERIGSGGFGEVWKAEAPGGIHKAVKIIHGDLRSREHDLIRYAEQELKALKRVKSVRHPYLLALDRFDIVDGRLMIVMELADCNLWDRFRACRERGLPGIPRDELLLYMQEAAEVLDLMNDQHGLQHLDIKPQNLFMLHNHVKVADFGQVKDLQGFMASVTGGITPVYAAPETFDGIVSRYCDQYSLACVYQELLTGIRPFDGTSMSQLLMQHLQLPPNLQPSPASDRPALARALAKKPEDRWPSVSAFIKALREGESRATARMSKETASPTSTFVPDSVLEASSAQPEPPGALPLNINYHDTSQPRTSMETAPPLYQPAPPEVVGNGPIQPTLILGLGHSGLRVLQHLRFELEERYGSLSHLPAYRTIYIDTDPETLEDARLARPAARLASLPSSDIIDTRINRAAHYMKPRLNGRSLLEGWFDAQLLYKIPRNPTTMGLRIFGRLAFCDQFRAIMAKIQSELDGILAPEALMATSAFTNLEVRTNRPRVYIIAGLAGGTGSGMFIDLAYSLRQRLLRRGYDSPDIVGLFFVPHASTDRTPPLHLGNTYAALVELNHYSRSDTNFFAHYDDRNGIVRDKAAPFRHFFLLPTDFPLNPAFNSFTAGGGRRSGPISHPTNRSTPGAIPHPSPRMSGVIGHPTRNHITPPHIPAPDSRIVPATSTQRGATPDSSALTCPSFVEAAEYLRFNMLTLAGRTIDDLRQQLTSTDGAPPPSSSMAVTSAAVHLSLFRWPRGTIVARTASPVARRILKRWIEPDPHRAREVVPKWAADYWHRRQWDPEALLVRFRQAAENTLGCRLDQFIASATDSLVPRGWLSRLPRPEKVRVALDTLTGVFGPPTAVAKRKATPLEEAIDQIVTSTIADACHELTLLAPALVEDAEFRLSGAEEVIRQFLAVIDRLLMTCAQQAVEADNQAVEAHNLLLDYSHLASEGGRKPSATEFARALISFPQLRYQSITCHRLIKIYEALRAPLDQHLHHLGSSRHRLESALRDVPPVVSDVTADPGRFCHWLMPPECPTIDAAVDRFLAAIAHEDLLQIDRRVQQMIEPEYGGLFEASLNSADGPKRIVQLVEQEARAYLDSRLGPIDLTLMLQERYRTVQAAELAISEAYQQADPALELGSGPWTEQQLTVLAAPGEPGGEHLRELVQRAVPVANLTMADAPDELTIYRELPAIPITALPQLGPSAAQAYQTLPDILQCSLHSRLDVAQWTNIDQD